MLSLDHRETQKQLTDESKETIKILEMCLELL